MPYTLWSRNRLIGSSELAYRRSFPRLRVGDFEATELGEQLMPIILGVGPALNALYEASRRVRREQRKKGIRRSRRGDFPPEVKQTTEYADAVSAPLELESLSLESGEPQKKVIERREPSARFGSPIEQHWQCAYARPCADHFYIVETKHARVSLFPEWPATHQHSHQHRRASLSRSLARSCRSRSAPRYSPTWKRSSHTAPARSESRQRTAGTGINSRRRHHR